jgi:thioredoxin
MNKGISMTTPPISFDEFISSHPKPILADFWAEWCGPCKMMGPVLDGLAKEWKDKVTIIKVNSETKPHLAQRFGISSIPTLILFKNGVEVHRVLGAMPMKQLQNELSRFIQ